MKKIVSLAFASLLFVSKSSALSLDDIQFWIGSGTNRAALVVEWTTPESALYSTVPAPIADKSLVWGYRFNGTNYGTDMLKAIAAADPRLYFMDYTNYGGTFITGLGYNLAGQVPAGLSDGTATDYFTNNFVTGYTVDIDAAAPLTANDLYWGGSWGPNWETWTEAGDAGGFLNCPDRGTANYWTADDATQPYSGSHGQWEMAQLGMDDLPLVNGSWIAFSVAAGAYDSDTNAVYNTHKHAPRSPDPSVTALVKDFQGGFAAGQWQAHFVSCTNWTYSLERSADLRNWTAVTNNISGTGGTLAVPDPTAAAGQAFYRIKAEHP